MFFSAVAKMKHNIKYFVVESRTNTVIY